jgi:hypothetical protein
VQFEAPAYHGENRWCADWDFLCSNWLKVPSALFEESAPSATIEHMYRTLQACQ